MVCWDTWSLDSKLSFPLGLSHFTNTHYSFLLCLSSDIPGCSLAQALSASCIQSWLHRVAEKSICSSSIQLRWSLLRTLAASSLLSLISEGKFERQVSRRYHLIMCCNSLCQYTHKWLYDINDIATVKSCLQSYLLSHRELPVYIAKDRMWMRGLAMTVRFFPIFF